MTPAYSTTYIPIAASRALWKSHQCRGSSAAVAFVSLQSRS